jgi:hypothetical protein
VGQEILFLPHILNMGANMDKMMLMEEARLQTAALKRLARWAGLSIAFSASGVVLLYYMVTGEKLRIWLGVIGVLILILGTASALTLLIGIRNGRNNVKKILRAIEDGN